jgi:hypothetical protein
MRRWRSGLGATDSLIGFGERVSPSFKNIDEACAEADPEALLRSAAEAAFLPFVALSKSAR